MLELQKLSKRPLFGGSYAALTSTIAFSKISMSGNITSSNMNTSESVLLEFARLRKCSNFFPPQESNIKKFVTLTKY